MEDEITSWPASNLESDPVSVAGDANNRVSRPLQNLQSLLSANCLLGDDSTKVFTVKIPESENVSVLKKMIKEENNHDLAHLDAKDLIL